MHVDEGKKFDIRNIEKNIRDGRITLKDYENYLSRLPDVSDKIYIAEENPSRAEDFEEMETSISQKPLKKKSARGK